MNLSHRVFLNSLFNFKILVLNEGLWSLVFIVSSTLGTNWIQLKRFQVLINQTLLLNDHRILNYEYCILIMAKNSPQTKLIDQESTYLLVPAPGRPITTKNITRNYQNFQTQQFFTFSKLFSSIHDLMKSFFEKGAETASGLRKQISSGLSSEIIKKVSN